MNWNRGLFRITLILSIIGAFIGAGLFFYNENALVNNLTERLMEFRSLTWNKTLDDRSWIESWINPPLEYEFLQGNTLKERQMSLWENWTGLEWGQEPWGLNDPIVSETEEEQKERVLRRNNELESLKIQGWQTPDGEVMPLTPEEVWKIGNQRMIEVHEILVLSFKDRIPLETTKGAFWGFCVVKPRLC